MSGTRPIREWPAWIDDVVAFGPIDELGAEWKSAIGDAIVRVLDLRNGSLTIVCPCCGATKEKALTGGGQELPLQERIDRAMGYAIEQKDARIGDLTAAGDRLMFVLDHCELPFGGTGAVFSGFVSSVTLADVQAAKREWLRAKDGEDPEAYRGVSAGGDYQPNPVYPRGLDGTDGLEDGHWAVQ